MEFIVQDEKDPNTQNYPTMTKSDYSANGVAFVLNFSPMILGLNRTQKSMAVWVRIG